MPFTVACPGCRTPYNVKDEHRGLSLRCVRCQNVFPAVSTAPAQPAAAAPSAPPAPAAPPRPSTPPAPPPAPTVSVQANLPSGSPTPPAPEFRIPSQTESSALGNERASSAPPSLGQRALAVTATVGQKLAAFAAFAGKQFMALPRRGQLVVAAGSAFCLLLLVGTVWLFSGDKPRQEVAVVDTKPEEKEKPAPEQPKALPPLTGNEDLSVEAENKVKRATVHLVVHKGMGKNARVAGGSGFFALEKGVIVTNAHVIGMKDGDVPPSSIEVILNSTEKDEKKLSGQVVAVDRDNDLAVVQLVGFFAKETLPPPLMVKTTAELGTRHKLWVFGFPLTDQLGQGIVVTGASVSSLPKSPDGSLHQVLLTGNMQPGNSGGPVVDARGDVVGVAVAILVGTGFNFAVPGEQARSLVHGKCFSTTLGQPYIDSGKTLVPIRTRRADPLNRMAETAVDFWTGRKGDPRPASTSAPAPAAGDSEHVRVSLTAAKEEATGTVTLPNLPSGQVYWYQPRWKNAAGETHWGPAMIWEMKSPPVERKPADLFAKYVEGNRQLSLNWTSTAVIRNQESVFGMKGELAETTRGMDKDVARVRLQHSSFEMSYNGKTLDEMGHATGTVVSEVRVDAQGHIVGHLNDLNAVAPSSRKRVGEVQDHVILSLKAFAVTVPNDKATPLKTWNERVFVPLIPGMTLDNNVLEATYTYLGTRSRNGRQEAVIGLGGTLKGGGDHQDTASGNLDGFAVFDLAAGVISEVDARLQYRTEEMSPLGRTPIKGTLEVTLRRGPNR